MESNKVGVVTTGVEDVEEETYERIWNIKNFDLVVAKESLVAAQKFELKTGTVSSTMCTWLIGMKKKAEDKDWVNVYCQLLEISGNAEPEIEAVFRVEVRKNNSEVFREKEMKRVFKIGEEKESTGKIFLIYASEVKDSVLNPDKSGVINVKLTVLRHASKIISIKNEKQQMECRSYDNLHSNMLSLLSDEHSSDVKIITVDEMEFPAHKLILQVQNPVFTSMLRSDLSESNTGIIKVNDICGRTMEIILRYLYTGDLLPSWCDPDVITEFTYAAGKYQLTEILHMLDNTLGDHNSRGYKTCYCALLSLSSKLSLQAAEKRLLQQIIELTKAAQSADELFDLVGEQDNKAPIA